MIVPNHRIPFMRALTLLLVATVVTGCMLARSPSSVSIISPEVEMAVEDDWPEVEWTLLVQRPVADQMRNSDRILVRVSRSRLQPWADAAWLDSMPDMVHGLLIQSLEDSERFAGVGRAGGIRSRFSLVSEVRRFEVVDDGDGSLVVELALQSSLVHQSSGRVMDTRSFRASQAVSGRSLDAVIEAFEQAMSGLFGELTGWLLTSGEEALSDIAAWRERSRGSDQGAWRDRRERGEG